MKLCCFLFAVILSAHAQPYKLQKAINIDTPTEVSIDRSGNVYFATFQGDIVRYNPELDNQLVFSPQNPNTVQNLEAWQGLRIFTFHRDLQEYRLINRNLSLDESYQIPPDIIGFAEMAAPSYDNNIWVIDQTNFTLKKIDIFSNTILSSNPLSLLLDPDDYEILYCKEYQNRLFISTKTKGILIFDNFGNFIKLYDMTNVRYFNFWKNTLYYLNDDELMKIDLYNDKTDASPLPSEDHWLFALIYENKLYLFSEGRLMLFVK